MAKCSYVAHVETEICLVFSPGTEFDKALLFQECWNETVIYCWASSKPSFIIWTPFIYCPCLFPSKYGEYKQSKPTNFTALLRAHNFYPI